MNTLPVGPGESAEGKHVLARELHTHEMRSFRELRLGGRAGRRRGLRGRGQAFHWSSEKTREEKHLFCFEVHVQVSSSESLLKAFLGPCGHTLQFKVWL